MAYVKTEWLARQGNGHNKFTKSHETDTSVYLENTPESITEPGTAFTAERMNHLEQGVADAHEEVAAKQDKIAATGASNLLTAPAAPGGQPGAKPASDFVPASAKGAANGVASLDPNGKVPTGQLPDGLGGGEGSGEYTYIIDSNAKLAAWAENRAGNDYSRVLIKAGTWTLNTALSGGASDNPAAVIDISNGRTKSVVGESGSRIVIKNTLQGASYIAGIKGSVTGAYPNLAAPEKDYFFRNVNVSMTVAGDSGIGFYSCANLTNCACTSVSATDCYGFLSCTNLANCVGTGSGHDTNHGFNSCTNLTNCTGIGSGNNVDTCIGFYSCRVGFGNRNSATASSTATFYNCYMTRTGSNSADAWAMTAAGGWNG